jgi:hypothetical protein
MGSEADAPAGIRLYLLLCCVCEMAVADADL